MFFYKHFIKKQAFIYFKQFNTNTGQPGALLRFFDTFTGDCIDV